MATRAPKKNSRCCIVFVVCIAAMLLAHLRAFGRELPIGPAALLGEAGWTALPLVALRRIVALLFVVAAAWLALGALHLI